MGNPTFSAKDLLNPENAHNIKQHFIYNGDGNVTNIFYAQSYAEAGEPCMEQILNYTSVSGQASVSHINWRQTTWSGGDWDVEL